MEKQDILKIQQFSSLVGDFIRYWGFRKIHGQIWAAIYLSRSPLSGIDLVKILDVSKALVSPALKELEDEGLIFQTKSENSKTKRYEAEENVTEVIHNVLKRRERPMLDRISKKFEALKNHQGSEQYLDPLRLNNVDTMIQTAQMGLIFLLEPDKIWKL